MLITKIKRKIGKTILMIILTLMILANPAMAEVLHIWVDDTLSVQPESRNTAIENICQQLRMIRREQKITELRIYHFGNQPWIIQPQIFLFPVVQISTNNSYRLQGELKLIKSLKQRADAFDKEKKEMMEAKIDEKFSRTLPIIRNELNKNIASHSNCTALFDVLTRASDERGISIILTDGLETCLEGNTKIRIGQKCNRMIILLMSGKNDFGRGQSASKNFLSRKRLLLEIIPQAIIEPSFTNDLCEILSKRKEIASN